MTTEPEHTPHPLFKEHIHPSVSEEISVTQVTITADHDSLALEIAASWLRDDPTLVLLSLVNLGTSEYQLIYEKEKK